MGDNVGGSSGGEVGDGIRATREPVALKTKEEKPMMLGKMKVEFVDSAGLKKQHDFDIVGWRADLLGKEERVVMGKRTAGSFLRDTGLHPRGKNLKERVYANESVLLATPTLQGKLTNDEISKKTLGVGFRYVYETDDKNAVDSADLLSSYQVNIALKLGEDGKFQRPSSVKLSYDSGGRTIDLDRIQELVDEINKLFKESAEIRAWFKKDTGLEWGVKGNTEEFKKHSQK